MRELIINGITVDFDDKTKMDLQFISFLFTSINSISAPRSWTVSLPKSAVNMGLIEGSSSGDYAGDFPYNNYVVDYYNKGFRLINTGKGILTKIGSRIEFVFTFGKAFEKIKLMSEVKLTELTDNGQHLDWNRDIDLNDDGGYTWCNFYNYTNEDRSMPSETPHADIFSALHPTVKLKWVALLISDLFEVDLSGIVNLSKMDTTAFVLRNRNGESTVGSEALSSTASGFGSGGNPNITFYLNTLKYFILQSGAYFTKRTPGSEIWVKEMNYSLVATLDYVENITMELCAMDSSGNYTVIKNIDKTVVGFVHTFSLVDYSFLLDANYTSFFFAIRNYSNGELSGNSLSFKSYYKKAAYNNLTTDGYFPIIPNLPDITCSDFLFQCMQLAGLFPSVSDETPDTIDFFSAADIKANLENYKDWTNKLVKSTPRMSELSDVEFKFGSYAQRNILSYKPDETNTLKTDDALIISNDNLELESKLVELKFAAGKRFSTSDYVIDYPLYDVKIVNTNLEINPKTQNNDVLAKIVNVGGINYLKFTDDLLWSSIKLESNYAAQQSLLETPRYIKENFYLKPEDVQNFSTKIPIYLQQYGKFYAVMKLQYRESEFSECELLELKNI